MDETSDLPLTPEQRHIRDWLLRMLEEPGRSKKALADFCGVSAQAVTKWVREGKITKENLRRAADYFGATLDDAYGHTSRREPLEEGEFVTIGSSGGPVHRMEDAYEFVPSYRVGAAAGHGSYIYTDEPNGMRAYAKEWLRKEGLNAKDLVMIEVDGDSMWPTICDGDNILVDTSRREIITGEVYVFRIDHELRVKRLRRNMNGTVTVTSDNKADPAFQEETCTVADLALMNIIGTVVHRSGRVGRRPSS